MTNGLNFMQHYYCAIFTSSMMYIVHVNTRVLVGPFQGALISMADLWQFDDWSLMYILYIVYIRACVRIIHLHV